MRPVSGTITYDEPAPEGPPSGNAMVSIEPQGTAEVRNALNLESDYFLHMDIPETSSQYLNWPNLTSADAEWTLSQWVEDQRADGEWRKHPQSSPSISTTTRAIRVKPSASGRDNKPMATLDSARSSRQPLHLLP